MHTMIKGFFAIVFLATSTFAQTSVSVHLGSNVPFTLYQTADQFFLHDYLAVGFNAGVSTQLPLADGVLLSPGVEYNLFPYRRYTQEIFDGWDFVQSSSGQGIQQLRIILNVKLSQPSDTSYVKPFLLVSGGYTVERVGRVTLNWQTPSGSTSTTESNPVYQHFWGYVLGIGATLQIASHVAIEPAVVLRSHGADATYGLLNLNVIYVLVL